MTSTDSSVKTPSPPGGISIVVPVYRSEAILPLLVERIESALDEQPWEYEIVLVNDGSPDASWDVIERLVKDHSQIHGLNLMRNYGQHNALLCGVIKARYDVIVTLDDDLQHPPEHIPVLLDHLAPGVDVVYAPPSNDVHSRLRLLASRSTKLVMKLSMGVGFAGDASAFRVFRRPLLLPFENFRNSHVSIDVLLSWVTTHFVSVPVRHDQRASGETNYTFRKLVSHALNMVMGFSTLPLRAASMIGFLFTVFGFGVLIYVVGRFMIEGDSVPGFPFTASTIAIFAGAQLFALGIIGEYIARLYFHSMMRPTYVIREEIGDDNRTTH